MVDIGLWIGYGIIAYVLYQLYKGRSANAISLKGEVGKLLSPLLGHNEPDDDNSDTEECTCGSQHISEEVPSEDSPHSP